MDGLSDIDSLLLINETDLEDKSPQVALAHVEESIKRGLKDQITVERGRTAGADTSAIFRGMGRS